MNGKKIGRLGASDHDTLGQNLKTIHDRIYGACQRSKRDPASVLLLAVTKYGGPRLCQSLVDHGVFELGENRVGHLNVASNYLAAESKVRWHMIGHLQRNKLRKITHPMAMLHSLDSLALANEIQKRLEHPLDVLVQVNVSGEDQKSGIQSEQVSQFLDSVNGYDKLRPRGLMTMAMHGDKESARQCFRDLAAIRAEQQGRGRDYFTELSMGMSSDFEAAIEEGSTIVRIGRVLYERLEDIDNDRS
jgi:PLP dependent protein